MKTYEIARSDEQIDELYDKALDALYSSKFPGMTYEQGIRYTLAWILGESDDNPLDD
ncbi:MAG: hypothetical protein J6U51_01075 [Bacteroidales bacterium]|nr:hypothetical protein [Bacteroidales bacterium]